MGWSIAFMEIKENEQNCLVLVYNIQQSSCSMMARANWKWLLVITCHIDMLFERKSDISFQSCGNKMCITIAIRSPLVVGSEEDTNIR